MDKEQQEDLFDLVIVGGGLSGILAGARVARECGDKKILLLEKDEQLGGRLRSSEQDGSFHSFGLKAISKEVFNYWNQVQKSDPDGEDLPHFGFKKVETIGVLAAGAVRELALRDAYSAEGAKAITGGAGVRDWKHVDKLCEAKEKGNKSVTQTFTKAFTGTRKSPSAIVLNHLSRLWGIPDLWNAQADVLLERAEHFKEPLYISNWKAAISALLEPLSNLTVKTSARVLSATFDEDKKTWQVQSERGAYKAKKLLVAQSIWEATFWLPRSQLPQNLAGLATRTTPTSLVVLSDTVKDPESLKDLCDVLLIPAEGVQVMIHANEVCFQATLDFELTMQAQGVVKAIKRLKRARKKFLAVYPDIALSGNHIALIPVGWAQPVGPRDQRFLEKIKDFQSEHLMFCGDTYGQSTLGDQNFLSSVTSACEAMTQ